MTLDLYGSRLARLCLNPECRVGSFRFGSESELQACPACGAEGAELVQPPECSSAADGRDQRDPQAMGECLLSHATKYRELDDVVPGTLSSIADFMQGTLEDHVPDYVDGDTIAKYGDPRQVTK